MLAGGQADVRGDGVAGPGDGDVGEQQPGDALAFPGRGGGVVPDAWQVGDQLPDPGLLGVGELPGGGLPLPWTVTTLGSLGTGGTPMVTKYQKFGDGYKAEAVKLYRESDQTIAETARNLGLKESTLANWVKKDKENEAVAAGEAPLTPAERTRIRELEADVRRLNMENAFLKKASAYFASQNL